MMPAQGRHTRCVRHLPVVGALAASLAGSRWRGISRSIPVMDTGSPLLPSLACRSACLAWWIPVFAIMKLRAPDARSRRGADRLSKRPSRRRRSAALARRPAPQRLGRGGCLNGADGGDDAVLEALPVGILVTDEAGVVRRCTLAASGSQSRGQAPGIMSIMLGRWPAIADGLAGAHAGRSAAPFVVLTQSRRHRRRACRGDHPLDTRAPYAAGGDAQHRSATMAASRGAGPIRRRRIVAARTKWLASAWRTSSPTA
jgi:hypothetical protein